MASVGGTKGGQPGPPKPKPGGSDPKRCACCGKAKVRLYGGVCKPCLTG